MVWVWVVWINTDCSGLGLLLVFSVLGLFMLILIVLVVRLVDCV